MIGQRIAWPPRDQPFPPGAYAKHSDGTWHAVTPNGLLAWLRNHMVEEHEDGTISVSPSIHVRRIREGTTWHGYIEKGVWREV